MVPPCGPWIGLFGNLRAPHEGKTVVFGQTHSMLSKRTLIFLTSGFGLLSSLAVMALFHPYFRWENLFVESPWDVVFLVWISPSVPFIWLIEWLDPGQVDQEPLSTFFFLVFPHLVWGLTGPALVVATHWVIRKRALSHDPLRAELRRRERGALVARRLEEVELEAEAVRAQILVLTEAAPDGAPSSWTTEVLRAEIGRRDQLESLQRDYDRLTAEVERLTRALP
jgi:hypothetical protein